MLNEGTTALPYEPYGKVWYKYGAIKKNILKPTTITLEENGIRMSNYSVGIPATTYPQIYCEYFRRASNYQEVVNALPNSLGLNTSGIVLCNVSGYTTTTEYANLFNNNDIYVYFPLATPTITEITDTTLINQLEAIKLSYNEQTNISQTNADKPFILDVTALKDLDAEDTTSTLTTNQGLLFTQPPVSENFINDEDDNSILEETINEEEPNIEDDNREEEEPVGFFEKEIINNDEEQEEIPTEPIEIDNGQR